MTIPRVVFDTNAILHHRLATVPGLVSAVVLQELTAGAGDDGEVRRFGVLRAVAEADGALVTPERRRLVVCGEGAERALPGFTFT